MLVVLLTAFAVGPAAWLPRLSAHAPTIGADSPRVPHAPQPGDLIRLTPGVSMAIKVKDAAAAAKKFKERATAASGDYGAGVATAGADWEAKSIQSEEVYKQSVMEAASKGRYGVGVRGSAGKYTKNATTLGPQRYQQGIGNAQDAYAQGMGPVLSTIGGLTLPPRGVKGTNQERSNIVATALRKMKFGG